MLPNEHQLDEFQCEAGNNN